MKVFHDYDDVCGSFDEIDIVKAGYSHSNLWSDVTVELCFALVSPNLYPRGSALRVKGREFDDHGARAIIVVPVQVSPIIRSNLSCANGLKSAISKLSFSP
jgi:hypothetical protein